MIIKQIREDGQGSGYWNMPRGNRRHRGIDFLYEPGDILEAPFPMRIERESRPYADDPNYTGIKWSTESMNGRIWYFVPYTTVVRRYVLEGQPIGVVQDIAKKYNKPNKPVMKNHIHVQVNSIDFLAIMELFNAIERFK